MSILSVDLAYKSYCDMGVVVLQQDHSEIKVELIPIPLRGGPVPEILAQYLADYCKKANINVILLDGPQGWKAENNGLIYSRVSERRLNTPAKTGLPFQVKPANYLSFVNFSIAVFDALAKLGWPRLAKIGTPLSETGNVAVESFPLSAWKTLGLKGLPAKSKAKPDDLNMCLDSLMKLFSLRLSENPTHDELQAIVAGLAGLALERNDWEGCKVSGSAPILEDGSWREGYIVNALRH